MKKVRPPPQGNTQKHVLFILEKLVEYLGHNNQKFREECEDVFASLPSHLLTPSEMCYQVLCETGKDRFPKVTVGRLKMIERIMAKYEMGSSSAMIIEFGKNYLQDKHNDIRTAAIDLMVQISKEIGYDNLYRHIDHLKPHIIRLIENKFKAEGGSIVKIGGPLGGSRTLSQPQKQNNNPEYYCDYCKKYDKRFED